MSLVKWVQKYGLRDGPQPIETGPITFVPVIPLAALTEVVEGLREYASCGDGCTCGDGWSHTTAQRLLAQLEAHRKEGA